MFFIYFGQIAENIAMYKGLRANRVGLNTPSTLLCAWAGMRQIWVGKMQAHGASRVALDAGVPMLAQVVQRFNVVDATCDEHWRVRRNK